MPLLHAGRAGAAIDLGVTIESLRAHLMGADANKAAVMALLAAVAEDPDDDRQANALHLMLDTTFHQEHKKSA